MKKIPTLLVRDSVDMRHMTNEVTPGCEWVLAGEGVATRKYDGTCVMMDENGDWWARREVKADKMAPPNWVFVERDEITRKMVGWEPIEQSSFAKFHHEALEVGMAFDGDQPFQPGTYELCGPKINRNPEDFSVHELVKHETAQVFTDIEPWKMNNVDIIKATVLGLSLSRGWEGIVWHHPDGRMAKLKARDIT